MSQPAAASPGSCMAGLKESTGANGELFSGAESGDAKALLTLLVRQGADPNARGAKGRTALLAACHGGHHECVRILLWAGATADAANDVGVSPLHVAVAGAHVECVRLLLEHAATTTQADLTGKSALDYACSTGSAAQRQVSKLLQSAALPPVRPSSALRKPSSENAKWTGISV